MTRAPSQPEPPQSRGHQPVPAPAGGPSDPSRSAGPAGWLLVAIIASAVLAPAIPMPASLPDIRVEELLALPALAYLLLAWRPLPAVTSPLPKWRPSFPRRARSGRGCAPPVAGVRAERPWGSGGGTPGRIGTPRTSRGGGGGRSVDLAFLALALATLISIAYAGLVLRERVSPRDGYEVVKLGLYWVLFRFALAVGPASAARRVALRALFGAGAAAALFGLAQYFDWLGLAGRIGHWWAPEHHLRALARDGRAFGTVGNPNYFGAMMALVAVTALAARAWLPPRRAWVPLRLTTCALGCGALGVVLSGSRGALALLIVAVAAIWTAALVYRAPRRGLAAATGLLCVAFAGSVLLVELFPRGRQDYLARVGGALSPTGDSDFALRLERWRNVFGSSSARPTAAVGGTAVTGTGRPEAERPARARDAQRKADVTFLAAVVARYREANGRLPESLAATVPGFVPALPADPLDGTPYRYERTVTGYTVAARLEDPADPDYPQFATGLARNYIFNGDVEEADGERAAEFRALAGTSWQRDAQAALFGAHGLVFRGNPATPRRRAAVYQQRFIGRPGGAPFTASVRVMLPGPVMGEVYLYTNVLYTDGERADPYARVAADSSLIGVWQRLAITITPEAGRQVDFIGVYLLSDDFQGEAYADGFELVDGSVPVTFTGLPEAEGSAALGLDAGAQFRRSPVFGVGPQKANDAGTVDNEYLLVLARYGLAGLAAYLVLWGAVLAAALRHFRAGAGLAIGVAGAVAGLLVFDLVAGSLYQLQLMGLFWPLAGAVLAVREASSGADSDSPRTTPP